jgi:pimeloyl-ACP methyl ester carboxylesterase
MRRPRLLLVPSFTELEWGIRPQLEEWADVASFDMPGVGDEPLPEGIEADPARASQLLGRWREAGTRRALEELDRQGWERCLVVADDRGSSTAVAVAARRAGSVLGLAFGHASLSKSTEGERPPQRAGIWDAIVQLARQGNETFVRYGIAQATRGGFDEETARQMIERFPDMDVVAAMVEALGRDPEPIGDELAALELPLLLAKHEGCLGSTDEGFEDMVAAFPDAETVICPEACSSSPAFADAIKRFCDRLS